jgi:hypothetical protein
MSNPLRGVTSLAPSPQPQTAPVNTIRISGKVTDLSNGEATASRTR